MPSNTKISNLHLIQVAAELLEIVNISSENPLDIKETIDKIVPAALNIAEADFCSITVINPITHNFFYRKTLLKDTSVPQPPLEEPIEKDDFLSDILKKESSVILVEDIRLSQEYEDPFSQYGTTGALAILKLMTPRKKKPMPLAVIYLGYKEPRSFPDTEKPFFRLLANQAASVLQHTWSLRRLREVSQIGQEINQELTSIESIFERLRRHTPGILDTSYLLVMSEYIQGSNKLDFYYIEDGRYETEFDSSFTGATAWAIENKEEVIINDYKNEIGELEKRGVKIDRLQKTERIIPDSMFFMPLMIRDTAIGALSIQNKNAFAYDNEDIQIMRLLTHHVSLALSNLRIKNNLEKLNETGQKLTQKLDTENILQEAVDSIREATKADIVSLHRYDDINQTFKFPILYSGELFEPDFPSPDYSRPDDTATLTLQHGEPIFAQDGRSLYEKLGGNNEKRRGNFEVREKVASTVALPLKVGEQSVGVLFINFRQPHLFSGIHQQFISGLANYAAIAIKNSRLFGDVSTRRIEELNSLREIDRAISKTLNLENLLQIILEQAMNRLQFSDDDLNGSILLHENIDNVLRVRTSIGSNSEKRLNQTIDLKDKKGLTYYVTETKAPIRVDDVDADEWKDMYLQIDPTTRSEMDLPLLDENENVIGIISFESDRLARFTQEDQDFLMTLANQAVLALKNAQAYQRERQTLQAQQAVQEIEREIISQLDFNKVANLILDKALELTDSQSGVLFRYDAERSDLYMAAERGVVEEMLNQRISVEKGLTGWAIRNKQKLNVNVHHEEWKNLNESWIKGVNWSLIVPMLKGIEQQPLGAITLESESTFDEQDERLLMELADLAVIALENATNYGNVEKSLKRLEELYEVGKYLGGLTNPDEIEKAYEIVGSVVGKQPGVQAVVRRFEPGTNDLVLKWNSKEENPPFERINIDDVNINSIAALERKIQVEADAQNPVSGIISKLSDVNVRSLVAAPIEFGEKYYGNLSLSHRQVNYFAEMDLRLIQGLAQLLGITIHRLEAEKQARELETIGSIGQISFELAHRIGNYLGWVAVYFDNPIEQIIPGSRIEKLNDLISNVKKVVKLSSDIKAVITAPSEQKSLISVAELMSQIRDSLPQIPANIDFNWEVKYGDSRLLVNVTQIISIIINLVSNAIDELSDGGIISVSVSSISVNPVNKIGDSIAIKVKDNGRGIPKDSQSKIFELLVSGKKSSGFGLWSARRWAFFNKGELNVENNKIENNVVPGATFTLILPKVEND